MAEPLHLPLQGTASPFVEQVPRHSPLHLPASFDGSHFDVSHGALHLDRQPSRVPGGTAQVGGKLICTQGTFARAPAGVGGCRFSTSSIRAVMGLHADTASAPAVSPSSPPIALQASFIAASTAVDSFRSVSVASRYARRDEPGAVGSLASLAASHVSMTTTSSSARGSSRQLTTRVTKPAAPLATRARKNALERSIDNPPETLRTFRLP